MFYHLIINKKIPKSDTKKNKVQWKTEGPIKMIQGFKNYLQINEIILYELFEMQEDITVLNCIITARCILFLLINKKGVT